VYLWCVLGLLPHIYYWGVIKWQARNEDEYVQNTYSWQKTDAHKLGSSNLIPRPHKITKKWYHYFKWSFPLFPCGLGMKSEKSTKSLTLLSITTKHTSMSFTLVPSLSNKCNAYITHWNTGDIRGWMAVLDTTYHRCIEYHAKKYDKVLPLLTISTLALQHTWCWVSLVPPWIPSPWKYPCTQLQHSYPVLRAERLIIEGSPS